MTLPASKDMRRPLLDFLRDKKVHSLEDTIRHLAGSFDLTDDDKNMQTSGGRAVFSRRVTRTVSAFRRSGLLANTSMAKFRITDEGVRASQGSDGDLHRAIGRRARRPSQTELRSDPNDPLEVMQACAYSLGEDLKSDLLAHIAQCSPAAFEELVVQLLVKMGYGGSVKDAGKAVGRTGDGGIDGVIKEDELGLRKIYFQAKRWKGNVGDREVRDFLGALDAKSSDLGILITTGGFTAQAQQTRASSKKSLVLVDGDALAGYMIGCGLGVRVTETHEVKEIDARFFSGICGAA